MGVPGIGGQQMAGLSGGQFQRVLRARALLSKPDLLVLDEPTQGLDQPGQAAFYRVIEEVRRKGAGFRRALDKEGRAVRDIVAKALAGPK